jgi:hypothetical protein
VARSSPWQKTAQEEEELVGRTVLKVRATRIIANRAKDIVLVPESRQGRKF